MIYSFGWGDCPSGCMARRFWKFNVYPDCSVEYLGSYGSLIRFNDAGNPVPERFVIYPNPFSDAIFIEGFYTSYSYSITSLTGQLIMSGESSKKSIDGLSKLPEGFYLLIIKTENQTKTFKILKTPNQ